MKYRHEHDVNMYAHQAAVSQHMVVHTTNHALAIDVLCVPAATIAIQMLQQLMYIRNCVVTSSESITDDLIWLYVHR